MLLQVVLASTQQQWRETLSVNAQLLAEQQARLEAQRPARGTRVSCHSCCAGSAFFSSGRCTARLCFNGSSVKSACQASHVRTCGFPLDCV